MLKIPAVRAMAGDPRLLAIAAACLGGDPFPYRATLFDKSLSANWLVSWHQDTALPIVARADHPLWGPWTIKGGVLHAIAPASALERIIALRVHLDDSQELAARVPPIECVTPAGGVVAMQPLTVHASSKVQVDQPRRVIHIEYATGVSLDHEITLAVE